MLIGEAVDLAIPAFLVVTKEDQERRKAFNAANPIQPTKFIQPAPVLTAADEAALEQLEVIRKADEKLKRESRKAAKAVAEETLAAERSGKVWRNGHWTIAGGITRSNAARILRELPTERHCDLFVTQYGDKVIGGLPKRKKRA